MNIENLAGIITALKYVAIGVFTLAAVSGIISLIYKDKLSEKICFGTMAIGWLFSIAVFVLNWVYTGHPPFGNMYHVLMSMGIFIPPLYLIVAKRDGYKFTHFLFAIIAVCALIGAVKLSNKGGVMDWRQAPALQSKWFVPHVSAYVISYSLMAVSFILTIGGLVIKLLNIFFKDNSSTKLATNSKLCYRASYSIVKLSLPFMTFGLLTGAIWADEIWGAYWSWDIKEVWSLITWSLYATYLHMRFNKNFSQYVHTVQIVAFSALICTFIIVNFMPKTKSMHSYAKVGSSHVD